MVITTFYFHSDFRNDFFDLDHNNNPKTQNAYLENIEADAIFSWSGFVFVRRWFDRDVQGKRNEGYRICVAGQIWTRFEKRRTAEARTDAGVEEMVCVGHVRRESMHESLIYRKTVWEFHEERPLFSSSSPYWRGRNLLMQVLLIMKNNLREKTFSWYFILTRCL